MLKLITKNSLSMIVFSVIFFTGCTQKGNIIIPSPIIKDKSEQCLAEQYKSGYTLTGSRADSKDPSDHPLIVYFDFEEQKCTLIAIVQPNFEKQRLIAHFTSFECENRKVKHSGHILDIDCESGLSAKHIINQSATSYLKDQIDRSKVASANLLKEYENAKKGYLETESNRKVFVAFE